MSRPLSQRARVRRRAGRRRRARLAARDRALALRARGWGYKRIARELGVDRDKVRGLIGPGTACPDCGGLKSRKAPRCVSCTSTNRPPTERGAT